MDLTATAIRLIVCPRCEAGPRAHCVTVTGLRARYPHSSRTEPLYEAWRDGYGEGLTAQANYAVSLAERHPNSVLRIVELLGAAARPR